MRRERYSFNQWLVLEPGVRLNFTGVVIAGEYG
jgi:hypothetical protein